MKPFLFGFSPEIRRSAFFSTEEALNAVGGNTGNLAFCYAIDQQLGGNLASVLWHASPQDVDALGGVGVLTLANQLGGHVNYEFLVKNFRALETPLVGIGLGAQAAEIGKMPEVPQGTLEWIKAIQAHSPRGGANIGMRGQFSLDVLDHYGLADRAVVTGCPTLFISPDERLGATIAERFSTTGVERVAVAAGHQRWTGLARLEGSLCAIMSASGGAYIVQSPLEMVHMGRDGVVGLSSLQARSLADYAAPHLDELEFKDWAARHARAFFSAAAWMEYLRRFDFVVGPRIHGVMLALQVGVPGLCIVHDSRTKELCDTMRVPYVMASRIAGGVTRAQLSSLFEFDAVAFDENRRRLASNYVRFLESNGLVPAPYMNKLSLAA